LVRILSAALGRNQFSYHEGLGAPSGHDQKNGTTNGHELTLMAGNHGRILISPGLKGQCSVAQGNALGNGRGIIFRPERAAQLQDCVALSGLKIDLIGLIQGLAPGYAAMPASGRNENATRLAASSGFPHAVRPNLS